MATHVAKKIFDMPDRIAMTDQIYEPDLQGAYEAGSASCQSLASQDHPRVLALLIDIQVDFVFPAPIGRLSVPNAVTDTQRTLEWLHHNVHRITEIAASLDTHTTYQIFYPGWWKNVEGKHPVPYTVITAADVRKGVWRPVIDPIWSVRYLEELENVGKKQLMIWPFHCMEGTSGRSLVPALAEMIIYHSGARQAQPNYVSKGMVPQTEFYSVVEPEVKYGDRPESSINHRLLENLKQFDLIYIAGQARSHCVLETLNSIMRHYADQSAVLQSLRFLDDCTSSIPGFEAQTEARLNTLTKQGMRIVKSTDPIG